ncbi:MAG: RNB domain-containing ribonuclease [Myxococcaceae bacterium]
MATAPTHTVTGEVDVHPRGFGFLEFELPGEATLVSAFVPPPVLAGFVAGDRVTAEVAQQEDGRWAASKLELISRVRTRLFGEVAQRKASVVLRPDKEVANSDWPLETGGVTVASGDAVVARLEDGRAVLERKLAPEADRSLERIIVRHELTTEFPPDVLEDAQRATAIPHVPGARRDLRGIPTCTVDSPTTRDIDDAISILPPGPDGALRLLVSIADASEFVIEGTPLDRTARERAASVYLTGRTLPMLPEALSTEWVSLVPGEDRLTVTAELRIDPEGRITAVDVYESILHSDARLSYEEVSDFLDNSRVSAALEPLRHAMPWFRAASARLAVARTIRGGIDMAREEGRFTFDEAGEVTGIEAVRPTSAHKMIERFMVAANESVATWLASRGVPAPFRVHELPGRQALEDVEAFALSSGYPGAFGNALTPLAVAAFDEQITGSSAEAALRSVLRRALGPSRYTVHPGIHFGLAAERYVHFTSPIRRYADLLVHRALKQYLRGRRDLASDDPAVEALSAELNRRMRVGRAAQRDRHRVLEARVMARHVGETFTGRIVRVSPNSVLVQLDRMFVSGSLPLDALGKGPWQEDARRVSVRSPERQLTLGAPITVKISSTDELLGRIELAPAEA